MRKLVFKPILFAVLALFLVSACKSKKPSSVNPGKKSNATGLAYNKKDGFKVASFKGQPTGPNLIFIEGGRFTMGSMEEDVMYSRDNLERTVTVNSFYMDEVEIANINWLEYLEAIKKDSAQEVYEAALPDSTVWKNPMSFNDTYVDQYLRYPGFRSYPVVGVSWVQANDYSKWRTDAVNNDMASRASKGSKGSGGKKGFSFKKKKKDAAPQAEVPKAAKSERVKIETGNVLPNYRLPTEAEWEYAAKALIGTQDIDENQTNNRIYPWDGSSMRKPKGKTKGLMLANFKRGRGDYAGIAGKSNDNAIITAEVYGDGKYPPNDFGLYQMAGNVNEWVLDLYRPNSYRDFNDLNPYRRDDHLDEAKNYDKSNFNSLVDNKLRVYKGGSWNDVAYWLSPGTRRFLDQDSSTAMLGFRCAMIAVSTASSKGGKRK
jgi:formylglycine-generating enzyme